MITLYIGIAHRDPDQREAVPTEIELADIARRTGWKIDSDPDYRYLVEMSDTDPFWLELERTGYVERQIEGTDWQIIAEY